MPYDVIITTETGVIREYLEDIRDVGKLVQRYNDVYVGMELREIKKDVKVKERKLVHDNGRRFNT